MREKEKGGEGREEEKKGGNEREEEIGSEGRKTAVETRRLLFISNRGIPARNRDEKREDLRRRRRVMGQSTSTNTSNYRYENDDIVYSDSIVA